MPLRTSQCLCMIFFLLPLSAAAIILLPRWRKATNFASTTHSQSRRNSDADETTALMRYPPPPVVRRCGCRSLPEQADRIANHDNFLFTADKCWHDVCSLFAFYGMQDDAKFSAPHGDFYDLLRDPATLNQFVTTFATYLHRHFPDLEVIVALDTHGYLFGMLIAHELRKPFVPVRKLRTLPGDTEHIEYTSKTESGTMCVQRFAIQPNQKLVVVDEKLATGGSLTAAFNLLIRLDATILGCVVALENVEYDGRQKLREEFPGIPVLSVMKSNVTVGNQRGSDASSADANQQV